VVSLLLALCPAGGTVQAVDVRDEAALHGGAPTLRVSFDYRHARGTTAVTAWFRQAPRQPRPAAYAIDQRAVRRSVSMPDYRMSLEPVRQVLDDGPALGPAVPLDDPLVLLLRDFLQRITAAATQTDESQRIATAATILHRVYRAAVDARPINTDRLRNTFHFAQDAPWTTRTATTISEAS
jgi:hypothetical protein